MNTTESNAAALVAHIEAKNAESAAWAAEPLPEGCFRCAAEYSTDPAYWAKWGVFTPYDFDRSCALDEYSDFHKDCYGFRPRNCGDWTLEQLEAAIADLSRYAKSMQEVWAEEAEQEAKWLAEQRAKWEEEQAEWAEEMLLREAEESGDWSSVNAEHRSEYTTEQAPLGSIELAFGIAC